MIRLALRILALICALPAIWAGGVRADTPLFASHEIMDISIPLDFKDLCRPREDDNCDYEPTELEFVDGAGAVQSLPVEVIIRGGWRSLSKNCSAPLLFIRFDESKTAGTPFDGQSVLPLTTHCGQGISIEAAKNRQRRSTWEQYLLKEYLAHRLYNLITEVSLNARLVRVTYINPDKPKSKISNYAFFTEHFESVARRNHLELLGRGSFEHEQLDLPAADQLALFEYMIGNTDWSVVRERNVILLRAPDAQLQALPYDFDMSGLVNAHYAGPAPRLPIDEVRERYYLGYCHPETDWFAISEPFLAKQFDMLSLVNEIPGLDEQNIKSSRHYLETFFETLQSPGLREEKIASQCQPWPPGPEDHTTPLGGR